ncbi:MAG: AAA family ATPase [Rhodospirillales bacterium]|nr:AAA family ATPase [Rhodospirillales bacterium]
MYISEIFAAGFRCFSDKEPLRLGLRPGLNILVGPNDAGKTAIIDAPRHLLWTRGDDYVRLGPVAKLTNRKDRIETGRTPQERKRQGRGVATAKR